MKYFIVLTIILMTDSLFSQEQLAPAVELFFGTSNVSPSNSTVIVNMQSLGQVWGATATSSCDLTFYETTLYQNESYTVNYNNSLINTWGGYDFVTSPTNPGTFGCLAYGIYKMNISINGSIIDNYFYLDYRDCRYTCYSYLPYFLGHSFDIWIKYNATENKFYYNSDGSETWNSILKGQVLSIWGIKDVGVPSVDQFIDFWSDYSLVITENGNNHPLLIWGPNPNFNATHYKVYRALSNSPVNPLSLTYSLHYTLSSSTFSFSDVDIVLDPTPNKYAYYYIKAYNSVTNSYSDRTNIMSVAGDYLPQKMSNDFIRNDISKTFQIQNYPNPFNPETKFTFSTIKPGLVNLTIFDILGREIETLVDEFRNPGVYELIFNSKGLSAGIYIYQLRAGDMLESNKMILMK